MKTIYKVLFLCLIGSMAIQTGLAQQAEKPRPSCIDHGGTVYGQVYWIIATLRSGCTRGIGFRCGTTGLLICGDHTIFSWKNGALVKGVEPERVGQADLTFDLKQQQVTFIFSKPLPGEKEDDPNLFTVDNDVEMEIPETIYLDKQALQRLVVKKGEYKISYENSKYGEVTFDADIKL